MIPRRRPTAFSSSVTLKVNSANPLARQLKFWPVFVSPDEVVDIVSGHVGVVAAGTPSDGYSNEGHFGTATAIDLSIDFDDVPHDVATGPYTLAARYNPGVATENFSSVLNITTSGTTGLSLTVPLFQSGRQLGCIVDGTSGFGRWNDAAAPLGVWGTWSVTQPGASASPVGYKNGILQTLSSEDTIVLGSAVSGVKIFNGFRGVRGDLAWAAIWNRQLSDAEEWKLHWNPRQMFRYRKRVMWLPLAPAAVAHNYSAGWR